MIFLIGAILDALDHARIASGTSSDLYSLASFRVAFAVQFVIVGAGVVMLLLTRRRTRRVLLADEGIEVAPIWVAFARRWKQRRGRTR